MENEEFLDVGFLDDEQQNAFLEDSQKFEDISDDKKEEESDKENENKPVTEDNSEEDNPESVGNDEDKEEYEDTSEDSEGSPVIPSIAQAYREAGVLQTLNDERIASIQSTEDLADAMDEEIRNRMDKYSQRVLEAMKYEIPVPEIQKMENALRTLENINDEFIENEENENARCNLIYRDLLVKGHSEEEAQELVKTYVDNGKDIEKAKKALENAKQYYTQRYDELIKEGKRQQQERKAMIKKQVEQVHDSIMNDEKVFKELDINKTTREKIFECVMKATEKDEQGNNVTKLQKYMNENPEESMKMFGMVYVLTDGFKNIDKLMSGPVKKEKRKAIDKLTQAINSTQHNNDGSLRLQSGVSSDFNPFDLGEFKLG